MDHLEYQFLMEIRGLLMDNRYALNFLISKLYPGESIETISPNDNVLDDIDKRMTQDFVDVDESDASNTDTKEEINDSEEEDSESDDYDLVDSDKTNKRDKGEIQIGRKEDTNY